jgi:Domain of unknown function (DUF6285)
LTQDRPDAAELLDAVAEFLFGQVRDAVPREQRFQVLVAANLCAVVAREIRAGRRPLEEDLGLFAALLDRDPPDTSGQNLTAAVREAQSQLARRLRAGELDGDLPEVAAALREHVRRKLAVARPGYDEQAG